MTFSSPPSTLEAFLLNAARVASAKDSGVLFPFAARVFATLFSFARCSGLSRSSPLLGRSACGWPAACALGVSPALIVSLPPRRSLRSFTSCSNCAVSCDLGCSGAAGGCADGAAVGVVTVGGVAVGVVTVGGVAVEVVTVGGVAVGVVTVGGVAVGVVTVGVVAVGAAAPARSA